MTWTRDFTSDGTTEYSASDYTISPFYDRSKISTIRLAYSQGHELAPSPITEYAPPFAQGPREELPAAILDFAW